MELSAPERLYRIARLLRDTPLTVRQLVRSLGPTLPPGELEWLALERSVRRDLELLASLEQEFEDLGGRPRKQVIHINRQQLHPVEILALHAAGRLVYHRSVGHNKLHLRALKALAGWLPERVRPVVARSVRDVGKRHTRESAVLERAAEAWLGGFTLRFEYQSASGSGAWRSNELEIYLIEVHPTNLDLYAVGREVSFHQQLRTFKLARMRGETVMHDRPYQIPDTFEPGDFFEDAWGVVGAGAAGGLSVKLRFAPEVAGRILEGGYPNMSLPTQDPDGAVRVEVRAGTDASGLPRELMPWILGWGARVEVLGPPAVREYWLNQARAVVERYGGA
ncbi:WYL domain-containing protein [Deinococcus sp.]|uniref:helix-turn-helix transcriptional regulator n=1 Tax=Deinococcus sp. TaxID=47478 RepID=UPI0025E1F93A|nr:WYL domain-containing protein [Deinococcus sp.]